MAKSEEQRYDKVKVTVDLMDIKFHYVIILFDILWVNSLLLAKKKTVF